MPIKLINISVLVLSILFQQNPLILTGSDGARVKLEKEPERIVAFDSGAVEILFALGEGHRVVGAHQYLSYPAEARQIEKVGSAFALNYEKIAALKPDLISIFFDRFVGELKRLDVPVLFLEPPKTLEETAARMLFWGKVVGRREEGEKLAERFLQRIEAIKERLESVEKGPRVFHDAAPGLWTMGSDNLAQDIYTLLMVENVFADLRGARQVSAEAVLLRSPEVILSVHPDGPAFFENHAALRRLPAVVDGRLHVLDADQISIAAPRLADGIERLAEVFYPELFP